MSLMLTQQEAATLLALDKHYRGADRFDYPGLGGALRIPLHSNDNKEEFSLDVSRGYIKLTKNTFQTRVKKTVVLARIDLNGPPHRNPDGMEIPCPHLHLYREGYNDKWAFPLPTEFTNHSDISKTLDEFMNYCNVVTKPKINRGLFI